MTRILVVDDEPPIVDFLTYNLQREHYDVVVAHDEFAWLPPAALFWQLWVSAVFLRSYLDVANEGGLLPESRSELNLLLRAFLLDRCVYELGRELANRPDWLRVPLDGIVRLLKTTE